MAWLEFAVHFSINRSAFEFAGYENPTGSP